MVKRHLKALTVPVTWPIKRKGIKFVIRPYPGKPFKTSIPLALIFKEMLNYCKTSKEVKTILMDKEILVDGVRRKEPRYLVGIFDVLQIPLLNENYRMVLNLHNKLELIKIPENEVNLKVCKIIGKPFLKKGKIQLNLYDGRNILVNNESKKEIKTDYKIGDSLLIKIPTNEILEHLKLEKGNVAYLIKGSHIGELGEIEKVDQNKVFIKINNEIYETPKDAVYVVGKERPAITITNQRS